MRWCIVFSLALVCLATSSAVLALHECDGPFKGSGPTYEQFEEILTNHQEWYKATRPIGHGPWEPEEVADEGRANLCGADMRGIDLYGVKLSGADLSMANLSGGHLNNIKLSQADLSKADLSGADIVSAYLVGADLREAALYETNLQHSNLNEANLRGCNLDGAALSSADLSDVDLREASLRETKMYDVDLSRADLTGADLRRGILRDADLSRANLTGADLTGADLTGTNLEDAYLFRAAVTDAKFYPKPLAEVTGLRGISGLSKIHVEEVTPLIALRSKFKEAGFKSEEKELTSALRKHELKRASKVEQLFMTYVMGGAITDFGADPSLAVITLFALVPVFWLFYLVALWNPGKDGIWQRWLPDRSRIDLGDNQPVLLKKHGLVGFGYALYFSLLSAFHIGWRDLNVGSWISRIQPREYTLSGSGWVRTVSGIQSLISVYLLAIAALSYFGRPFE